MKELLQCIVTLLNNYKVLFVFWENLIILIHAKDKSDYYNELIAKTLAVVEQLASYGFYQSEDDIFKITKILNDFIIEGRPEPFFV